ncbi:MAG TPA: hypothetical protein VIE44_01445 [Methylomirabilota bacterium]|jgi:hypothetical protein
MSDDAIDLDLARRRRLLVAALAAARLAAAGVVAPALADCARWLDRWTGLGLVAAGMARQGFDLELTRFGDEGWRATFSPAGRAHSAVSGSAWEATPWRAVQRAAWEALG